MSDTPLDLDVLEARLEGRRHIRVSESELRRLIAAARDRDELRKERDEACETRDVVERTLNNLRELNAANVAHIHALCAALDTAKRHAEHIEMALREPGRPKQAIGEMAAALVAALAAISTTRPTP